MVVSITYLTQLCHQPHIVNTVVLVCVDCITNWLQQWSQTITGFGSVLVSLLLVILYYRQQQELAANHKGLLEVTSADWNRNELTAEISNYGNGTVSSIYLQTLVYTESGEHRKYTLRNHLMKRQDKQGEWANAIQSEEEDIPFKGKSKIGTLKPGPPPEGWYGITFGLFMRQMKAQNVGSVKYVHQIKGFELSGNRCLANVSPMITEIDAQNFGPNNSIENPPSARIVSNDDTFISYTHPSRTRRFKGWIYHRGIELINWLLFFYSVGPRPQDLSGRKYVKRVILWRTIGYYFEKSLQRVKRIIPIGKSG
ncbi:hypothetical protein [Halococcus agarilyticus]|uniref:hypothetical protein n=1 Tax=Halococcus agarilyticus TaxID=1232219 RepID=UPI0012ABF77F|nr:hypothetical protein [Halococcus agarilyticus]